MLLLSYFILNSFLHAMDANNIQQGCIIRELLAGPQGEGRTNRTVMF